MTVTATAFGCLSDLVRDKAGIVLEAGKEYLVECRLRPVMKDEGVDSLEELIDGIRSAAKIPLRDKIIDAMTTNETSFFRDLHPFTALRETIIPKVIEANKASRKIHIWCMASSSGQEIYTIAMTLKHYFPELATWDVTVLGTDISPTMVSRAAEGRYSQLEVNRGLPALLLTKYFKKEGSSWCISKDVMALTKFKEHNLLDSCSLIPPSDIIFLRNVLIYFDRKTKEEILAKAAKKLHRDGVLFLGGSETVLSLDTEFERKVVGDTTVYKQKT